MTAAVQSPMSMLDAATMFQDPPAVAQGGRIIPMSQWLGHRINEDDVLGAAQHGYGRDWFRYWHRRIVFDVVWAEGGVFDQVRAARSDKDIFDDFSWNQTYIFGHYGRGKSTKFVHSVLQRAAQGIPTFHNGPVLGGWLVEGDDIFTAMQGQRADRDNPAMPKCSVLGIDEAHGTAPGRLAASTAVSTLRGLAANIRKLNVDWYLIGAQWKDVHPQVLDECVEAIEVIEVAVQNGELVRVEPWNDISHFVLAYQGWSDFPFKRMRERQRMRRSSGDEAEVEGLGPAEYARLVEPEFARWAFAATDSFRMVDLTAIIADKDAVKATLRGTRDASVAQKRSPYQSAVLEFCGGLKELLESPEGQDVVWVTPGDIARLSGVDPAPIGKAVSTFGVKNHQRRGYLAEDLVRVWEQEMSKEVQNA